MTTNSKLELEFEKGKKTIHSERYLNCIAYHAYDEIPENELVQEVYKCKNQGPPVVDIRAYFQKLTNEGILDKLLVPEDERIHYKLSPLGKYTLKRIIDSSEEKYEHPSLVK